MTRNKSLDIFVDVKSNWENKATQKRNILLVTTHFRSCGALFSWHVALHFWFTPLAIDGGRYR